MSDPRVSSKFSKIGDVMKLGPDLDKILREELAKGNRVAGEYSNKFARCKKLILLGAPFHSDYPTTLRVTKFENRDSHYPVGVAYEDSKRMEMLLAPFS